MIPDRYTLAGSEVSIPALGVGTWAWGDRSTWGMGGYDTALTSDTIREAWDASIDAGVTLFDTAEVYGGGESERIIGDPAGRRPRPGRLGGGRHQVHALAVEAERPGRPPGSLRASLERLGRASVGLYQIHGPISLRSHAALADALAAAHQAGLVQAVGVSNYSAKETRSMAGALTSRGLRLATNQIEFSLLRRSPETHRSPGRLRASWGSSPWPTRRSARVASPASTRAAHPPPASGTSPTIRWRSSTGWWPSSAGSARSTGASCPSQVALNWVMAKGAVPIPGAKNRQQAEENAGALGWAIDEDDLDRLDRVALSGIRTLQSRLWQHG